ncbi:MAG: TetR/AcrR family transcriptional regulator [Treponema sp.]|jgi:AcrR family transcriptional regulator|nr:TetR/AcrR family transcriptional regulator [Treponema sp.]
MGIAERKEREKTERKALILECAKDLISTMGTEKVSMTDIAQKAELSKATLYLYFPSKELLFRELSETEQGKFISLFQSRLKPNLSALETIHLFWESYVDIYRDSDGWMILFNIRHYVGDDFLFLSDSMKNHFVIYTMLQETIEKGIAEGTMDPSVDSAAAARAALYLFSYIVENSTRLPGDKKKGRLVTKEIKKIFEIIIRGIARPGVDPSLLVLSDPPEEKAARTR